MCKTSHSTAATMFYLQDLGLKSMVVSPSNECSLCNFFSFCACRTFLFFLRAIQHASTVLTRSHSSSVFWHFQLTCFVFATQFPCGKFKNNWSIPTANLHVQSKGCTHCTKKCHHGRVGHFRIILKLKRHWSNRSHCPWGLSPVLHVLFYCTWNFSSIQQRLNMYTSDLCVLHSNSVTLHDWIYAIKDGIPQE